jgi:hypothetical protein
MGLTWNGVSDSKSMKKNNLIEKFNEIENELKGDTNLERLIDQFGNQKSQIVVQSKDSLPVDDTESEEEVLLWRKNYTDFNGRSTNFLNTRKVKKGFEESLQLIFGNVEIQVSFLVDLITNRMTSALENYIATIQSSINRMDTLILNQTKVTAKDSGDLLLIDFVIASDLEEIQKRKKFFQYCYYMKSRFEDTSTKVKVIHEHERIELSNYIGLRFVYNLNEKKTERITETVNKQKPTGSLGKRSSLKESSEI